MLEPWLSNADGKANVKAPRYSLPTQQPHLKIWIFLLKLNISFGSQNVDFKNVKNWYGIYPKQLEWNLHIATCLKQEHIHWEHIDLFISK